MVREALPFLLPPADSARATKKFPEEKPRAHQYLNEVFPRMNVVVGEKQTTFEQTVTGPYIIYNLFILHHIYSESC
jgi:hypothetical protein